MKAELSKAMSEQINKEYYSAFLYLAMANWCTEQAYNGAANWMFAQYQEELAHAEGIYRYMQVRGESVSFDKIDAPTTSWNDLKDVFQNTLEHEQFVTDSINNLANIAMDAKDHAAYIFLQWYVIEQVEEESSATEVLDRLKMAGNNANALLHIDDVLGRRTFEAPDIPNIE